MKKKVQIPIPDLVFLTYDHPEANNRTAEEGELEFSLYFPLENGRMLCIRMGKLGFAHLVDVVDRMCNEEKSP
jgi:hypothetical protein